MGILSDADAQAQRHIDELKARKDDNVNHPFTPGVEAGGGCTRCSRSEAQHGNEDNVNHPAHYTAYKGLEVIDLTEQMNFNRGNAVKYICRAGLKAPERTVEDLEKAAWYIAREINRIKGENK